MVFNASPKAIHIASCDTIPYKQRNSSCHSKRLELVEKKLKTDFNGRHSNILAKVISLSLEKIKKHTHLLSFFHKKEDMRRLTLLTNCLDHRLQFKGLVGAISRHPAPFGLSSERVPEGTGRHTPSNGNQHYLGQSDLCEFSLKLFRTFSCFWSWFQR